MPEKDHVSSIDAIESFRAALLIYLSKTRPMLDDAAGEVVRTREWLRNDRRMYWENQLRRRTSDLEQARQALFSAEISNLRAPSSSELLAVQRAKRAVDEAEERLKTIKRWIRDLDNHVEPLVKQLEQLRTVLSNDLPKAVAYLTQVIKMLDAYANVSASDLPASSRVETAVPHESVTPESSPDKAL